MYGEKRGEGGRGLGDDGLADSQTYPIIDVFVPESNSFRCGHRYVAPCKLLSMRAIYTPCTPSVCIANAVNFRRDHVSGGWFDFVAIHAVVPWIEEPMEYHTLEYHREKEREVGHQPRTSTFYVNVRQRMMTDNTALAPCILVVYSEVGVGTLLSQL